METSTIDNLKFLVHTAASSELASLWNSGVVFLSSGQIDINWSYYHWFKEINKRYFYSYGSGLYANHDGGFTPKGIPTTI